MNVEAAYDSFAALGTVVVVGAADPDRLAAVVRGVRDEIDRCDRACSRFRADSDLTRVNEGHPGPVSEWLCEAVSVALDAARATAGLVDPTIGQCLMDLGYDQSFDRLDPDRPLVVTATHVPAWSRVSVDRATRRVFVPAGVRLDLGATAKALCADRAAARAAAETGAGVLVSLGGDIALAGPPPADGWPVRVTDRADTPPEVETPGQTVAIRTGGLATSGTSARQWARGGTLMHHLVDPRTGRSADPVWRTVTVAAPSCVAANTASTAAMILGAAAPGWLAARHHDARLVRPDGSVETTGAWPLEQPSLLQGTPK
ncbi:MAG: FAD:protein FMN transferase [Acidobacteriota bacterium]|nr:FAD:protein FMN transferase [Acidobacteriota bacterium]